MDLEWYKDGDMIPEREDYVYAGYIDRHAKKTYAFAQIDDPNEFLKDRGVVDKEKISESALDYLTEEKGKKLLCVGMIRPPKIVDPKILFDAIKNSKTTLIKIGSYDKKNHGICLEVVTTDFDIDFGK